MNSGVLRSLERRSEEDEVLARLRNGERIGHYETVRQTKDGRRLNISLTVSPVRNSAGQVIGASKVARDVTERKMAAAALAESETRFKMLTASAQRSRRDWICRRQTRRRRVFRSESRSTTISCWPQSSGTSDPGRPSDESNRFLTDWRGRCIGRAPESGAKQERTWDFGYEQMNRFRMGFVVSP